MSYRSSPAVFLAVSTCLWLNAQAQAETTYVVRPGDSLSSIAEQVYGDPLKWVVIYDANTDKLAEAPAKLDTGTELTVPAILPGTQGNGVQAVNTTNADGPAATLPQVRLIARSEFDQLIDRNVPGGGPLATYVNAAFREAGYKVTLEFADQDIDTLELQATFPHLGNERHEASHFVSEPIGTYSVSPFSLASAKRATRDSNDLRGLKICGLPDVMAQLSRILGKGTADSLLMHQADLPDCFRRLASKGVDVVLAGRGEGLKTVEQLDIQEDIEAGSWEIEIGSLHVLVPRYSSYGSAMIYRLNEALKKLPFPRETTAIAERSPAGQSLSRPLGRGGPKNNLGQKTKPFKRTPTM